MIVSSAWYEFDLTGDLQLPAVTIIQKTNALLHLKAADSLSQIIDLDDVDEIKVECWNPYSSIDPPIFTASLLNGKLTIIDADDGLFDMALEPSDTDFHGSAAIQFLYHKTTGETLMSPESVVNFARSRLISDVVNPPEVPLSTTVDFACTVATEVSDLVYVSASNTVDQALASDPSRIEVIGHVVEKPTTTTCKVSTVPGPVQSAGITAGSVVYLSTTTPGKVTMTPPVSPNALIKVGVAISATTYFYSPIEVVT